MINKTIILFLSMFCVASTSLSMECRGAWVNNDLVSTPFILTDNLKHPYVKWIEGNDPTFIPCPNFVTKLAPSDFHLIYGAEMPNRWECEWPGGEHQGFTVLDQATSGRAMTIKLSFNGSRTDRVLIVDSTSGDAEFFSITEQGLFKVSSSLNCTL